MTLMCHKRRKITNNRFHAPCVSLEITQILSATFPSAIDNKGVTKGDDIKWIILCSLAYCKRR
jgi:hypothetical protein